MEILSVVSVSATNRNLLEKRLGKIIYHLLFHVSGIEIQAEFIVFILTEHLLF